MIWWLCKIAMKLSMWVGGFRNCWSRVHQDGSCVGGFVSRYKSWPKLLEWEKMWLLLLHLPTALGHSFVALRSTLSRGRCPPRRSERWIAIHLLVNLEARFICMNEGSILSLLVWALQILDMHRCFMHGFWIMANTGESLIIWCNIVIQMMWYFNSGLPKLCFDSC